jgi:hypothetical protein
MYTLLISIQGFYYTWVEEFSRCSTKACNIAIELFYNYLFGRELNTRKVDGY